jgi:HlyD family secretion protein
VNEADIGKIHAGQKVVFTVDAFGDQVFDGVVNKVRLNATMSQNVVTYTVEVNHDNSDGKLLPYLTTNLQFETGHSQNVLLVPNAALRWSPRPAQIAHESVPDSHTAAERPAGRHGAVEESGAPQSHGTVWVPEGAFVRPVHVHVGLTDGMFTEVSGKAITEGLQVVTGETKRQPAGSQTQGEDQSPFVPQGNMFHRPR